MLKHVARVQGGGRDALNGMWERNRKLLMGQVNLYVLGLFNLLYLKVEVFLSSILGNVV
jgi:hypothetical protein